MKYTGTSDTTLMRLVKTKILSANQLAPYAPLEIKREDLDSQPVASIQAHLKSTGRLVLDGDTSGEQPSLFRDNQ